MEFFISENITDRIIRILMPGDVYTYVVKGDDKAVVIDTGCGAGPFKAYVEKMLDGMPYEVILTHGHVDHAGGASEFDRVWLHSRDWKLAAEHTQKEVRAGYVSQDARFSFTMDELVAPMEAGYLPMEYGQIFELGGVTLEILNFGGHTPGSVGILFQEEKILLTGDACCSFTLLFGGELSLSVAEYKKNLDAVLKNYQGTYTEMLYSHPHNYGGIAVIPEMIEVCEQVLAGTDDHIPTAFAFAQGFAAKERTPENRRVDGRIANLAYV